MKNLYFLLLAISSINIAFADIYALHFCEEVPSNTIEKYEQESKVVSFLKNEKILLIETELIPIAENDICFVSEVKTKEQHLAFFTNKIIVKVGEQDFPKVENSDYDFVPHQFIDNQFSLKIPYILEDDLSIFKSELETWLPSSITSINSYFTIDAAMVNDLLFPRQYSIENTGSNVQGNGTPDADMQVDSAWTITTGNTDIKIAVLDSGVDTLHEDLINNLLPGYDAFGNADSDTKGFPTPNFSSDGHGTACAGIAAAEGNNNIGVAGIAYNCKIIPIRFFYYQDYGQGIGVQATTSTEALVNGAAYAWRVGNCDVMSVSAGLSELFITVLGVDVAVVNQEILEAYYDGREGYGVPMFFSAGNDDINDVLWPADLSYTIAIGASTMCDERKNPNDCSSESWGSSYGQTLDVVAPGTLIASTDMTGNNGYSGGNYTNTFNGTSAACPNAAGVGALILSVAPDLHARDVKAVLDLSAYKVPNYTYDTINQHGSWNEEVGYGRVDAFEALKLAATYETTVSVSSIDETSTIVVYPNPSAGSVYFKSDFTESKKLLVYNVLGKLVDQFEVLQNSVIVRKFDAGIYFVTNDSNEVEKFLVEY